MKGKEAYEIQYNKKIENLIQGNLDRTYLRGFYNYMRSSKLTPATIYDYLKYVVHFINSTNNDLDKLDLDDYTNFLSQFSEMKTSYQIGVYSGLKKFAKYLLVSSRTTQNPMENIDRPKFNEDDETIAKREKGYLEVEEIEQYLCAAREGVGTSRAIARQENWKERDLLIILIFLNTGIRCSALYKLNLDDIDFTKKTLKVNEKGGKAKFIYLSDELLKSASEWFVKRDSILNGVDEDALFISNQRKRMDQSSISRVVKKYAESIEGKSISPHKLRATYGTHLYNETGDLYFVQDCMGHSNPKVTEVYIRGKNNNSIKASDIMSKIIK